jgi:hypothetical protein
MNFTYYNLSRKKDNIWIDIKNMITDDIFKQELQRMILSVVFLFFLVAVMTMAQVLFFLFLCYSFTYYIFYR